MRRLLIVPLVILALAAAAVSWFFSGDGIRRALERQASAWLGQPVHIASARAQIFPRVAIQLTDVRVGAPERLTLADVEVSTGLAGLLARRVEDTEVIVSDSRVELPLPFVIPTAGRQGVEDAEDGFAVTSIRAISLRNLHVASRGREIALTAEAALSGHRLDITRFHAESGATAVDASGTVELSPAIDAQIEASANRLDLDDLMALIEAFAPPRRTAETGTRVPGRLQARLSAAQATVAGVQLTRLAATVMAHDDRVTLSPASCALFGGRFEGALDVGLGDRLSLALTSRIDDLDAAQLAAFGGVRDAISGRLSGNGRFEGRAATIAAILAGASGTGTVTISNGTIRGLDLVRTVVLFFGRPAPEAPASAGERFTRIAAPFRLARQVLTTDALALESPDVDVAASGTLAIPSKALNGHATLILSEALSAQAGRDLVRYTREGSRVVLPATIGGTLDRPRVMIDAAAAVRRGLRNEMERRLKGLLDRLKPPSR